MSEEQPEARTAPARRLTLADLVVLVVAAAVGLMMLRMLVGDQDDSPFGRPIGGMKVGLILTPFLLTTTSAIVIARLRGPRPGFRAAIRQPGTLACVAGERLSCGRWS